MTPNTMRLLIYGLIGTVIFVVIYYVYSQQQKAMRPLSETEVTEASTLYPKMEKVSGDE